MYTTFCFIAGSTQSVKTKLVSKFSHVDIILSSMLTSHSLEYLMTMFLHCLLYSAMPILATSSGPLIPKVLSISYSYKNTHNMRRKKNKGKYESVNLHRSFSKIFTVFRTTDSYHRQAMTVPAKAPVHMEAALMGKASNNILDGAS